MNFVCHDSYSSPHVVATDVNHIRSSYRYAVSTRWERDVAEGRAEEDLVNKIFCCCARRVGNMYFLIEKQDGSPVVVAGPCWPFCVGVTVPLIVGISSAVIILIVLNPAAGLVRSLEQCLASRPLFGCFNSP